VKILWIDIIPQEDQIVHFERIGAEVEATGKH
jgi:hypothetical protein